MQSHHINLRIVDYEYLDLSKMRLQECRDLLFNLRIYLENGSLLESSLIKGLVYVQEYDLTKDRESVRTDRESQQDSPTSSLKRSERYTNESQGIKKNSAQTSVKTSNPM